MAEMTRTELTIPDKQTLRILQKHRLDSLRIAIERKKQRLRISCAIENLETVFSTNWLGNIDIPVVFPLWESITFDSQRGRAFLQMHNGSNEVIASKDITYLPELWDSGIIYDAVSGNREIQEAIAGYFEGLWQQPLPFEICELTTTRLIQLNMFINYPRSFYDCIPYRCGSYRFDPEMRRQAQRLHWAECLPALYDSYSGLPRCKSIRRLFFSQPALFFYVKECMMLFDIIRDPNRFCALIDRKGCWMLSMLHQYPSTELMLRDYAAAWGVERLCRRLTKKLFYFLTRCVEYASMSKTARIEMLRGDPGGPGRFDDFLLLNESQYSYPAKPPSVELRSCQIGEYSFCLLRTANEFSVAGKILHNCLDGSMAGYMTVVVVRREGQIVAAIEVSEDRIIQAYSRNNRSIRRLPGLREAVDEWAAVNYLEPPDEVGDEE